MFVDACAMISILAQEDTAEAYEEALEAASAPFTSALASWEAVLVLARPDQLGCGYSEAHAVILKWLAANRVVLREAVDAEAVLAYAVSIAEAHGVGKRALSNFDCFHYAHAKAAGAPMLTLDGLLRATDVPTLP